VLRYSALSCLPWHCGQQVLPGHLHLSLKQRKSRFLVYRGLKSLGSVGNVIQPCFSTTDVCTGHIVWIFVRYISRYGALRYVGYDTPNIYRKLVNPVWVHHRANVSKPADLERGRRFQMWPSGGAGWGVDVGSAEEATWVSWRYPDCAFSVMNLYGFVFPL